MAYNAISGTIIAAQNYLPAVDSIVANIVSGNLSTSDGASIINIPRVSNATNNSILTNVGGDANTLTCESNLLFDGTTLNITGHLTASIGMSASFLYGDGRHLTNITASSGGSADGQGPSGSLQFHTTGGSISGSARMMYVSDTLKITGSIFASGAMELDGDFLPAVANTKNLGSSAKPWGALYVSSSSIYMGSDKISVQDNNLRFGSGSTNRGFQVGFMRFRDKGIAMANDLVFQINAKQMLFAGGIAYKRRVVSWDYTITKMDYIVCVQTNTLTSSVTLTLPSADACTNGQTFVIKDEGGAANTHEIEVQCAGSDVIDGLNSVLLRSPYAAIQLYCNGADKYFIY
tara:strand:- start:744 stop:1784 length:1041 start_codon:yes stop_codon:yes gene_type:complete